LTISPSLAPLQSEWIELEARAAASPYQRFDLVETWTRHAAPGASLEPRIGVLRNAENDAVMILPFGVTQHLGATIGVYLGGSHFNLNMPLVDPELRLEQQMVAEIFDAYCHGTGADLLLLCNQPRNWQGAPHAFLSLPHYHAPDDVRLIRVPESDHERYLATQLTPKKRSELRRKTAKFMQAGTVEAKRAATPAEAERFLDAFLEQKGKRLAQQGVDNPFVQPGIEDFLLQAALNGLDAESGIKMHGLEVNGRVLAVYGGIRHGNHHSFMFQSFDGDHELAKYSPSEYLTKEVLAKICEHGVESFDFGIGEARYKRMWSNGVEQLFNVTYPVTTRGKLYAGLMQLTDSAVRYIKRNPRLFSAVQEVRALSARSFGRGLAAQQAELPRVATLPSPPVEAPEPAAASASLAPAPRPGAIILGGAAGAVAAARSLGRHGVPVWFVSDGQPIAALSRYVTRTLTLKPANDTGTADQLLDLAREHGLEGWVLIAGGDNEVRLISKNYAALSQVYRLTTLPWDIVKWADDKSLTYELAAELGIPQPKRYSAHDLDEVRRLDCQFPLVLKPAFHQGTDRFNRDKAWIAEDRESLVALFKEAAGCVDPSAILVQERVPGCGLTQFSYGAIWDRGRPVAELVARRLRQFPIDIGYTSTFVEVVENETVRKEATRFLSALDYSGPVEIEFKYDAREDLYKILDVNPRLWAWIGIAPEFPYLAYRVSLGETVSPVQTPVGTTWVHVTRDLVAAAGSIWKGRSNLEQVVATYRRSPKLALFAADDPLPALAELPIVLWRFLTRRVEAVVQLLKLYPRSR
jgi:predicted ATP-grasp superfamily ATP-dependent carboligase/CelD/BcsL family acetyltransferase involved in cellulose biosynthesis